MVTILVKPKANGSWSIVRCHITLFRDLPLGLSIKLARELARDEHHRFRRDVRVEMPGPFPTVVLANHTHAAGISGPKQHKHNTLAA